jgi:radical SAM superfamily enzyme YgiQ (UPF0313 family)
MLYPKFIPHSFWGFVESCEFIGARYPAIPLGLITVAAMLPPQWEVRLIDHNIDEDVTSADLAWADMVMTGGMLFQQPDIHRIIELAHSHGKPVVIGGPDVTTSPHLYKTADIQVHGEAEDVIDEFVAAWEAGQRSGVFAAPKFQVDITKTPIPRYDLLKLDRYLYVGVQFSRGCPFTCEFCDIIEIYGRVPRTKTTPQVLAELETLYQLGYRGHVDFVDDNIIGNKKAVKAFMPALADWLRTHDYPFEFSTEASINLADDDVLLKMMQHANFFSIFVGIESPDPETLVLTKKKQNTRRDLVDSVKKIYGAGMFVNAGFIIGFDTDKSGMAEAMIQFIEDATIPITVLSLLYALAGTQLSRRLEKEGRLHNDVNVLPSEGLDHCLGGLNFDTIRPRHEILEDYRTILTRVYDPVAFCGRIERMVKLLDTSHQRELADGDRRKNFASLATVYRLINEMPAAREVFWETFKRCQAANPGATRMVLTLMMFYLHLGPYSRFMIDVVERRIATQDVTFRSRARPQSVQTVPA